MLGAQKRGVQTVQHIGYFRPTHADNHSIGLLKIVERRPFLEKLRIAGDIAFPPGQFFEPRRNTGRGADWHGAFGDDDGIAPQMRCNRIHHRKQRR